MISCRVAKGQRESGVRRAALIQVRESGSGVGAVPTQVRKTEVDQSVLSYKDSMMANKGSEGVLT